MKAGWKMMRLGDVCHVYQPETLSQKQLKEGPYPVYGANGQIGVHSDYNHENPELTLGCRGTCGSVNWTHGKTWINGNAMVVKPDLTLVEPHYLTYALKGGINIQEAISGTAQPQITRKSLSPLEIPLPPLAEQKRIVALLDEAFAGIDEAKAKAEANLDSSSGLFDMVREDLMREPDAKTPACGFDEICRIDSPLVDPRENEYAEKLHIGGANIESKTGRLMALQTARQEGLKSGKFPFQKGMVLYSKIRPNLMKVARPDFDGLCSADMYPLAPVDGRVCRDYLYHLLLTERFTRFALLGSERAGMPKVNRDYLSRFTTKIPSISEQQAFASKLDALEQSLRALRELLTKKMAALQELKSSLLTQAFAGELTA